MNRKLFKMHDDVWKLYWRTYFSKNVIKQLTKI